MNRLNVQIAPHYFVLPASRDSVVGPLPATEGLPFVMAPPVMGHFGARRLRFCLWNSHRLGSATPLLVFNGVGMNLEVLEPLGASLSDRPVLTLDMPGVGGSPEPKVPYSPQMAASWGAQLLTRHGIGEADVLGFSWGGAIAQQFAIQHPIRVRRLAVAAIGPGLPILPGKATYHFHLLDPIWKGKYTDSRLLGAVSEADRKVVVEDLYKRMTLPTTRGYLYQIIALSGWSSAMGLPLLRRPTLIMVGSDDQIVPPMNGHWLAAFVPGSELEVIDGGGHLFMFSHHERLVGRLRQFLDPGERVSKLAAAA